MTTDSAVNGTPETAAMVREIASQKPCVAFTDSLMASAAYYVGSQANMIVASPSATVGSIGVMIPWVDRSQAYENEGLKVEVFKNSGAPYKGMGTPGTSLTAEQREQLQQRVDEIAATFKSDVQAGRNNRVKDGAMRGQVFMAAGAKNAGLIDEVGGRNLALRSLISISRNQFSADALNSEPHRASC